MFFMSEKRGNIENGQTHFEVQNLKTLASLRTKADPERHNEKLLAKKSNRLTMTRVNIRRAKVTLFNSHVVEWIIASRVWIAEACRRSVNFRVLTD